MFVIVHMYLMNTYCLLDGQGSLTFRVVICSGLGVVVRWSWEVAVESLCVGHVLAE